MLTEKEIQTKATAEYKWGYSSEEESAFIHGATWANEALSTQIAELWAVNSEQADKIAELLNLLRENLETTPAAMDYIQVRLKTKRTLEKHGVK